MDSLTQIVLGAAVGEVVMGKRIGNRAMVWGAIGGTIPDLDVIGNLFMGEVESLAFHRGISHSFFFAIVFPFAMAWLTRRWYLANFRSRFWYPLARWFLYLFLYLALTALILLICFYFSSLGGIIALGLMTISGYFIFNAKFQNRIQESKFKQEGILFKNWYWLYFWVILTHIILDIFTTYGTQALLPFSNARLAISSIAVVDPIYTIPFLFTLVRASCLPKHSSGRRHWVYAGLIVSSTYLLLTVFNKRHVNFIHQSQLISQRIHFNRTFSSPTIFNNLVWNLVADQDSHYIVADYGLLDSLQTLKHLRKIPKNHSLIESIQSTEEINILKWFSNNYFSVETLDSLKWKYCDLRFGTGMEVDHCVFSFEIEKVPGMDLIVVTPNRNMDPDIKTSLYLFWQRIKGL